MAICDVHSGKPTRDLRPVIFAVIAVALTALAAILRLHALGLRTFQADEGVASLIADQFARGAGYEHLPLLHGPLPYAASALTFRLLGAGDATARLAPALAGILLAVLPLTFHRTIGRRTAVLSALFLALSPTLLFGSRTAGPDIFLAAATLATAMIILRYLQTESRPLLYVLAVTLALAVATSEMALLIAPIFAAYLAWRTGADFIAQSTAPRVAAYEPTHYDTLRVPPSATTRDIRTAHRAALVTAGADARRRDEIQDAFSVLVTAARRKAYDRRLAQRAAAAAAFDARAAGRTPGISTRALLMLGAAPLALLWPFAAALRRRLGVSTLPAAAHPLTLITLLMLPFYGPLVEKLSFVGDRGFDGQAPVYVIGGGTLGTPGGELPVMLTTLGALFAVAMVLGMAWRFHVWFIAWAAFYGTTLTLFTGFFTNKGGVWTGLWGTLDYWWRPEARHVNATPYQYAVLLPAYEFVPLACIAIGGVALLLRGGGRNRIVLLVATTAFALIVAAPAWSLPVVADHRPLAVLLILGVATLSLRLRPLTMFFAFWAVASAGAFSLLGRKDGALAAHLALPMSMLAATALADALAGLRVPAFTPVTLRMPAVQAVSARRLAQGVALAAVLAASIVTLRTAVDVAWGGGALPGGTQLATIDRGDTPTELIDADRIAPDVREVRAAIERAGTASGRGREIPVAVDTSYGFSQGWLWYLRDYPNLAIEDMRRGYQAPAGAIVLFDARNRDRVQVDGAAVSLAFTSSWRFPYDPSGYSAGDIAARVTSAGWWATWSRFAFDRKTSRTPDVTAGLAYFPSEVQAAVQQPRESSVLSAAVTPVPYGPPAP